MYYRSFALRCSFLVVLLLITVSPEASSQSKGYYYTPQRLRVRVESNTLRSGQATKVIIEFLDRNYQRVPSDLPRNIQLSQSNAGSKETGSGQLSPQQIRIARGAWSAEASFVSRQPGRLLIVANSQGLDPGQVLVMVTRQSSWLSTLFETVAHAEEGVEILPKELLPVTANNTSPAMFFVSLSDLPENAVTVRVLTKPAARVVYQNRESFAFVDIVLDKQKAVSDQIGVIFGTPQSVSIEAWVLPRGTRDSTTVQFVAPRPRRIIFEAEPPSISSYQRNIPISLQLADLDGLPVKPEREEQIHLSSASDSEFITFEPSVVLVSPTQHTAQAMMRLKDLPEGNELKILALCTDLLPGEKKILIESPIEQLLLSGPTEVNRNGEEVQYTIRLADKNGKARKADWNRKIDVSVDGGTLAVNNIVISKGEESATVKYVSPGAVGRYTLTAYSSGITEGKQSITILTPMYWLIIAALFGGTVGGVVRHMSKDFKLARVKPRYKDGNLELGLLGHMASSLVCGLVFFLIFKFGLSKAFGASVLPASFEFGTRSVALLFGVIGGFAGTVVLDKLVDYFLPSKPKADNNTAEKTETHQPSSKTERTISDSMESFENIPRLETENDRTAVRASGWRRRQQQSID
jgi:hypothetical protein